MLTDRAAEKIKEIQKNEGLEEQGLRIKVIGGGCSGFSYDFFFEDKADVTELDQVITSQGITIYIDMMSYQYLEGTEVDYVETLASSGFKFVNPNATSTCGCGQSFST